MSSRWHHTVLAAPLCDLPLCGCQAPALGSQAALSFRPQCPQLVPVAKGWLVGPLRGGCGSIWSVGRCQMPYELHVSQAG